MPRARILTTRFATANVYRHGHPKVTIFQVKPPYEYLTLPFAPVNVEYGQLANAYNEIQRPMRLGLLAYQRPQLLTLTMTLILASMRDPGNINVEKAVERIRFLSRSLNDLRIVGYGPSIDPKMNFRVTDMSISSTSREPGTNKILKAEVNITLTQAPRLEGPVPGLEPITYRYTGSGTDPSPRTDPAGGGVEDTKKLGALTQPVDPEGAPLPPGSSGPAGVSGPK